MSYHDRNPRLLGANPFHTDSGAYFSDITLHDIYVGIATLGIMVNPNFILTMGLHGVAENANKIADALCDHREKRRKAEREKR